MASLMETAGPMITLDESEDANVLRPIFCELGVNNRPDGSAMLTQGDTAVMAAVYGPVEVRQHKILVDRGTVEVVHRPGSGAPRVPDRLIEDFLQKTCEAMILTTSYPRSSLCVITQEIEDSGGDCRSSVTLAFDGVSKGTIISHVTGRLTEEQYMGVLLRSRDASDAIFKFYRNIVTKYTQKIEQ